jgi:trigger factor
LEYVVMIDNEVEKEVEISVPAADLDSFIEKETNRLQKELTLKGFRKGKVPKSLIKTRYHDTLKAQAIDKLVTASYLKFLGEKKWRPASQAELQHIEEGDTIKFRLHFEIIPHFEVDTYVGLELVEEKPLPDDFLLEHGMDELRERFATIREVNRPAAVDDLVTVDLEIREKDAVRNSQSNVAIRIGDRMYPDEINRTLVGAKKAEQKKVQVGDLLYILSIKKIEEKILPLINDEFAKNHGHENVEALKKKLLDDLRAVEKRRIEEELKEKLSNILLERTHFTVPHSLIQNEYQKMLQKANLPDSDTAKERFWDIAEKRARFNLILDSVAEKEQIRVDEQEITSALSALQITLSDENRNDVISYMSSVLRREKTLDFLYKNAKISKKSQIISPKEATHDTSAVRHRTNRPR